MAAPPDPNLVIITSTQMYMELRAVTAGQSRIETKVDHVVQQQAAAASDHEQRLRALEARRWPLPVACALLTLISCSTTLWALLQRH